MPRTARYEEIDLLLRVAEGDEEAFTALFNHYQGRLNTIGLALTHSPDVAEELVQDVFLKVWLKRADLIRIESFEKYLFIILRNEAYDWLNKQARRRKLLALLTDSHPLKQTFTDDLLAKKESADFIRRAINHLPVQQQQVFRFMREQGLSREETALALQIHPNTVKTHMSRALKTLRAIWISSEKMLIISTLFIL